MGHFYEQLTDGVVTPRHFVPMTSRPDELRPTRISDVRKWWNEGRQVVPSVTTVLNVLDKPGLNTWRVDSHLRVAINVDQRTDVEQWIAEVKRLAELEMDKAPQAGTDIHKSLEMWFADQLDDLPADEHIDICVNVERVISIETAVEKLGVSPWQPERNFVDARGFGGQADLSGSGWVIDFKSKQTADKFKPGKMAYDEHKMQLAAYREGLGMPSARCANVFICLEDGQVDFHEHKPDELDKGWQLFQHALAIWQLQHGHGPGG